MATPLAIGAFYRRILAAGVVYLNLIFIFNSPVMTCMDSLAVVCEQSNCPAGALCDIIDTEM